MGATTKTKRNFRIYKPLYYKGEVVRGMITWGTIQRAKKNFRPTTKDGPMTYVCLVVFGFLYTFPYWILLKLNYFN